MIDAKVNCLLFVLSESIFVNIETRREDFWKRRIWKGQLQKRRNLKWNNLKSELQIRTSKNEALSIRLSKEMNLNRRNLKKRISKENFTNLLRSCNIFVCVSENSSEKIEHLNYFYPWDQTSINQNQFNISFPYH